MAFKRDLLQVGAGSELGYQHLSRVTCMLCESVFRTECFHMYVSKETSCGWL